MADKLLNLITIFSMLLGFWAIGCLMQAAIREFGAGPTVLFIVIMLILAAAAIGTSIGSIIGFGLFEVPSIKTHWHFPCFGPEIDVPMMVAESGYYSAWIIIGLLVIIFA